jgi:ABC-type multidrug transport system fused ATPase/permease subunit
MNPANPQRELKEELKKGRYSQSVYQTLWNGYKKYFFLLALCIAVGFIGRLLLLANTNIIGLWVDSYCQPHIETCKSNSIFSSYLKNFQQNDFISLLSGVTLFGFLLSLFFRVGFSRISARAVSQIYDETTIRTSRYPLYFFDRTPAGKVITRFSSDYGNVFRIFGGPLAEFLAIIFDLIAILILISFAHISFLPVTIIIGFIYWYIYFLNKQKLRQARRENSLARSPSIAHFAESTVGSTTIRVFNQQKNFFEHFFKLDSHFINTKIKSLKVFTNYSLQMSLVTALFFITAGFAAIYFHSSGKMPLGSIGVAFALITFSGNTIQMFFDWMSQFEEAMVGVERMDDYLNRAIEPGAKLPSLSQFPTAHAVKSLKAEKETLESALYKLPQAQVSFNNVSVRYDQLEPVILKNINFQIPPGERWGIIGKTGSGKSTLIQALFYLYPPFEGEVLISGLKPSLIVSDNGIDLEVYRNLISYISQQPQLFKASLHENLDITKSIELEKVYLALFKVGLEKFANPNGLKAMIEERGKNLSLGEKQLICMARCILQNRPVVVMDEATSSIDPHTEKYLVEAAETELKNKTQIIVAHRLSTIESCNKVLWLDEGQVKMIDRPEIVLRSFKH